MNINKIGQATPFIIVGIIVVILVVIVIFISKPTAISGGLSISQVASVKNFVEKDCVEYRLKEVLTDLRKHGGYSLLDVEEGNINMNNYYVFSNNEKTRYICCGPNYQPNTEIGIENEINEDIKNYLLNRCSLKEFSDDFDITLPKKSDIKVKSSLEEKNVLVNVKFPVVIKRGLRSVILDDVSVKVDEDIKNVNEIVREVGRMKEQGKDIDNIKFSINSDDIDSNFGVVLGDCNVPTACQLYIEGDNYLHIWTDYDINNNIEPFKFAIK